MSALIATNRSPDQARFFKLALAGAVSAWNPSRTDGLFSWWHAHDGANYRVSLDIANAPFLANPMSTSHSLKEALLQKLDDIKSQLDEEELICANLAKDDAVSLANKVALIFPQEIHINDASIVILRWMRNKRVVLLIFAGDGIATFSEVGEGDLHIQNTSDYIITNDYVRLGEKIRDFSR